MKEALITAIFTGMATLIWLAVIWVLLAIRFQFKANAEVNKISTARQRLEGYQPLPTISNRNPPPKRPSEPPPRS